MASGPKPDVGTQLGAYRLEAVLGRGGMGIVYRATDTRLGRQVALKVLPPEYGGDETFRSRFLRESRIAASIDHPGVIPIYEAGEADGQLYIAMRHVDGTDLGGLLREEGTLDPARAIALTGQLADALDAAHAAGLVHRDVKPSNALVDPAGGRDHVYLCDFGLSKEAAGDATLSGTGALVGTVKYMAPEVIRLGTATASSDLYSLGCLLFECLTGRAPFPGPSEAGVIYGHLEEPPPRVSEARAGLPKTLDPVLARALHKDPRRRWASGADLVQAARAALAGVAPRSRPRAWIVASAGAAAGVVVGIALFAFSGSGGASLDAIRPNHVTVIDRGDRSLVGQVGLNGAPGAIASGHGAVWVADPDRGVVSRLDLKTRALRATIDVGHEPSAIAVAGEGVWVANRPDGTLSVISARTNRVTRIVRVGRTVDGACAGSGGVWAASPVDRAVVRFNPATGRRTATVRLDNEPGRLACDGDAVWVSSPSAGSVTEISARAAAVVRTVQVGRGATAVATGAGGVWVANPPEGIVSRIDPARGVVTATIPVGAADGPSELAVTRDAVWVSSEFRGVLTRIDPRTVTIDEELEVAGRPRGLLVVGGDLWMGVADTGARHRGGTLRIENRIQPPREDYDLAVGYASGFAPLTNDGLTSYNRRGDAAGTVLVPNLAESLPAPSDGGRSYSFRLRRGIVYSTGEPVRAGHVRFALERSLRRDLPRGLFAAIRGASTCTAERCDLSRGIVTDDAAGTVVFRLEQPDPDLLFKLALPFASLLPPSVGTKIPAHLPLPATGPYRIAEIKPKMVRLVRNARFRSWSPTARPDGFPDEIVARFGVDDDRALERVRSGHADLFPSISQRRPEDLARIRRDAPEQLRESVAAITFYFVLNTRVPPFDDLNARRAVAFAFDRRAAVAAAGGGSLAQETCQILPPGLLGSRPYCPFTLPESDGASGRPNLAMARRLMAQSRTRRARVVVQAPQGIAGDLPQVMVDTLRRLGYPTRLRLLPIEEHFRSLSDSSKRVQVGVMGWMADYPAPSTFLDNFACSTVVRNRPDSRNPSQFCDRTTDRLMEEAARLQVTNPAASDEAWAQAERRIVDLAPAVAAYNQLNVSLVSERLGNYRTSPVVGELLDQMWVR